MSKCFSLHLRSSFLMASILTFVACVTQPEKTTDPILKDSQSEKKNKMKSVGEGTELACLPLKKTPPFFLESFVMTRFIESCVTENHEAGFKRSSSWMAMGFPCTAGSGRIDVEGYYFNPKKVTFILSTDCPMNPASSSAAEKMARDQLGLTVENKLIAFNPFVVQYWEFVDFPDADVGFTLDLVSTSGRQSAWQQFRDRQPLKIKLYGRENAWITGDFLYEVEATLVRTDRTSFQLQVQGVQTLSGELFNKVKQRCESLLPKRPCDTVFLGSQSK